MKKNRVVLALLFSFLFVNYLFGMPAKRRFLYISNMTNSLININCEIAPPDGVPAPTWRQKFYSETGEMILFCVDLNYSRSIFPFISQPEKKSVLFQWLPIIRVEEIPPIEKLNLFYSFLDIKDAEGNILKTLDTITEDDLTIDEYGDINLIIK